MSDYKELFYKLAFAQDGKVIVALECAEIPRPYFAELNTPYLDQDGTLYSCTSYLTGKRNDEIALVESFVLSKHAQLLAQRGDADHQFEGVSTIYAWGAEENEPRMASIERPQDFAVRHLTGLPRWDYRRLVYIVTQDHGQGDFKLRAGTAYIVNGWIDIPMTDEEAMEQFAQVFPLMSMKGNPFEPPRPMRPTDCLGEDDFWDELLGDPPAPCPDPYQDEEF